jgi:flagellar biosynthesis protein FliP
MNKVWIGLSLILAAFLHVHITDQAYQSGYEDAEKALGTTAEQCYRWWFGENKKQFEHEMKQFCKRSGV